MKKTAVILMAAFLCAVSAGCGQGGESSSQQSAPSSVPTESTPSTIDSAASSSASSGAQATKTTAKAIVEEIEGEIGIAMPADVDDTTLKDVFYINTDDVEEYYGRICIANTSADNVLAVKPVAGKKDAVKESLEKRLGDVQASFAQYLPDQSDKAQKGRVYEKGDYVFLLILGQEVDTFDADMQKALEIIDSKVS